MDMGEFLNCIERIKRNSDDFQGLWSVTRRARSKFSHLPGLIRTAAGAAKRQKHQRGRPDALNVRLRSVDNPGAVWRDVRAGTECGASAPHAVKENEFESDGAHFPV